jgi:amino acid permease
MMAEQPTKPTDSTPETEDSASTEQQNGRGMFFWPLVGLAVVVAVFVIGLISALLIALLAAPDDAANWVGMIRDIFIIVLAMEGMLMGIALIVLILQLAALVNLLQNEVGPIVDNANETVSTIRGTAQFVSQNVVEPVIKFGALTATLGGIVGQVFGIRRALRTAGENQPVEKSKE